MSKKLKLQDIHRRLKEWTEENHAQGELGILLNELDGEISTMDDEGGNGDPGGNNPPTKPKQP